MDGIEELELVVLFAGVAIGWLIQWLLDLVYWRRKRACTKIEDRLQSDNQELVAENENLRERVASNAGCEAQLSELKGTLVARDELIGRLQTQLSQSGSGHLGLDVDAVAERLAGRLESSHVATLESIRSELRSSLRDPATAVDESPAPSRQDIIDEREDTADREEPTEQQGPAEEEGEPVEEEEPVEEGEPVEEEEPAEEEEPVEEEEASAASAGPAHNNLYRIEHQWGGVGGPWRMGGAWVLGGRGGEPIMALECAWQPDVDRLVGTVTYAGAEPVEFRATKTGHNTYGVEERPGGDESPWVEGGTWLVGARWNHDIVALQLTSKDLGVSLQGTCQYRDEEPLGFRGAAADGGVVLVESQFDDQTSIWVIGARPDEPLQKLRCTSDDDGRTLTGTCSYDGDTVYDLRCARWAGNTYHAETRESGATGWEDAGLWVIGSSGDRNLVALELNPPSDGVQGGIVTYEDGLVETVRCRPAQEGPGRLGAMLGAVTRLAEAIE